MSSVHRLHHVERLRAANLSHDDPVWTHPKSVAHKIPLADLAAPLDIGRARLQRNDVRLLQLEFGGVFDGDNALRPSRSCARER